VEACCLIESILHQFKADTAAAQGKSKPGDHMTLGVYAALYGALLRLPEHTAILLTDIPEYRKPFALWRDLLHGAPFEADKHVPGWRDLYNRSKHRMAFSEFTLTMAIDALAGALVRTSIRTRTCEARMAATG
jgi:hypothetical protein